MLILSSLFTVIYICKKFASTRSVFASFSPVLTQRMNRFENDNLLFIVLFAISCIQSKKKSNYLNSHGEDGLPQLDNKNKILS